MAPQTRSSTRARVQAQRVNQLKANNRGKFQAEGEGSRKTTTKSIAKPKAKPRTGNQTRTNRRRYVELFQGQGGFFRLPTRDIPRTGKDILQHANASLQAADSDNVLPQITAVGATGCETCVGVYYPIDAERCFAAHISAHNYNLPQQRCWADLVLNPQEGASLMELIQGKLEEEFQIEFAAEEGWNPPGGDDGLIMVCPHPTNKRGRRIERLSGYYIIRAVSDFFGSNTTTATKHHAFCKDMVSGELKTIVWRSKRPSDYGWDIVEFRPNLTHLEWAFGYRDWEWALVDQDD